jgi:hypothetical protein
MPRRRPTALATKLPDDGAVCSAMNVRESLQNSYKTVDEKFFSSLFKKFIVVIPQNRHPSPRSVVSPQVGRNE